MAANRAAMIVGLIFVTLLTPPTWAAPGKKANSSTFVAVPLMRVDCDWVAKRLIMLLPGDAVVIPDSRSNMVLIRAGANEIERAREFIRTTDVQTELRVFTLKSKDPERIVGQSQAVLVLLALIGDERYVRLWMCDEGRVCVLAGADKGRDVASLLQQMDSP